MTLQFPSVGFHCLVLSCRRRNLALELDLLRLRNLDPRQFRNANLRFAPRLLIGHRRADAILAPFADNGCTGIDVYEKPGGLAFRNRDFFIRACGINLAGTFHCQGVFFLDGPTA